MTYEEMDYKRIVEDQTKEILTVGMNILTNADIQNKYEYRSTYREILEIIDSASFIKAPIEYMQLKLKFSKYIKAYKKQNKKYRWNYKTFIKTCIFSLIIALTVWFCISYMDVLANNLSANENTHSWNMIRLLFTKSL